MGLRNKDLISIHDLTVGEVATILDVAKKLKRKQKRGEPHRYLEGKTLAMIFSKASSAGRPSDLFKRFRFADWARRAGARYGEGAFPLCGWHYDQDLLARQRN